MTNLNLIQCLGMFYISFTLTAWVDGFKVFWNSPTRKCQHQHGQDLNLRNYGIRENDDSKWHGNMITIWYDNEIGKIPYLDKSGKEYLGGIPQAVNLSNHLYWVKKYILKFTDRGFNGYGVLDWEQWRPIYDRNWNWMNHYKTLSKKRVTDKHPNMFYRKVDETARAEFEKAAKDIMLQTLEVAKKTCPHAKWGYYGFPACYNHDGSRDCSSVVRSANDNLAWLFRASTAIYPTAYFKDRTRNKHNFLYGNVKEAMRVRDAYSPGTEVLLYTRYGYKEHTFYSPADLDDSIGTSISMGADGVILWAPSKSTWTSEQCRAIKSYVQCNLGQYVKRLSNFDKGHNDARGSVGTAEIKWPGVRNDDNWSRSTKCQWSMAISCLLPIVTSFFI